MPSHRTKIELLPSTQPTCSEIVLFRGGKAHDKVADTAYNAPAGMTPNTCHALFLGSFKLTHPQNKNGSAVPASRISVFFPILPPPSRKSAAALGSTKATGHCDVAALEQFRDQPNVWQTLRFKRDSSLWVFPLITDIGSLQPVGAGRGGSPLRVRLSNAAMHVVLDLIENSLRPVNGRRTDAAWFWSLAAFAIQRHLAVVLLPSVPRHLPFVRDTNKLIKHIRSRQHGKHNLKK